jgi:two-component system, NtrC family, nitrogen regulation sensor histidine kinase NtrY
MFLREDASRDATEHQGRRRLLDRPRVLVAVAVLLVALLVALFWLANRTGDLAPQVLSDALLYGLLAVNLLLLAALFFVLVRNLLKLWVEQRHAAPFARFRAKLVAALLAMTILPAVLVLLSGSQIIRDSAARWFSEPVEDVLVAAQEIARQYYREGQERSALHARRIARALPAVALANEDVGSLSALVQDEPRTMRNGVIEIYRIVGSLDGSPDLTFLVGVGSANLPRGQVPPSADRIAARVMATGGEQQQQDDLPGGGVLLRTAVPILDVTPDPVGVLVVSHYLPPDVQAWALEATAAYESYQGLRLLEAPIQGIYQSVFLAVSLLILISATWLGLYLAKRITRPVQMLADGARAIGAGQLDLHLEAETADELGSLVESFNMMAAQLRSSRERLEASRHALEEKNLEIDARRRYIETIMDRVATGVISLDAEGRVSTVNGAAERLLNLGPDVAGQAIATVFEREDLRPLLPLARAASGEGSRTVEEITLARDDREMNLAVAATVLAGEHGQREGAVLVLDDVTLLFRAQRVAAWRDVARRLAHEVKNPLTPIQLSAQRLRRHFTDAPPQSRALVIECTDAIVTEVEALKGLVDEFAQFARLRAPRMQAGDINRLIEQTLRLYGGVLVPGGVTVAYDLEPGLPPVLLDGDQMRQVVINLVDNAMEVLGGPAGPMRPDGQAPSIVVRTRLDVSTSRVQVDVTDNGPGVSAADTDKLFMPYYSTKGRGSGLGLAIVRRIISDHSGTIDALTAEPSGTTFRIELPCLRS